MDISVRDIHNDMIKPYENGGLESVVGYVTQKYPISDASLRLLIPPQVWKMTTILRQICEYELCIITKDMNIDLNRLRTRLVTYLQQKSVGRNTHKFLSSNTSAAHYKDKVFQYGECLYATIKYAARYIACNNIKPKNMIYIKCGLGFCDECTD